MARIFVSFHHEFNQEHANVIRSIVKKLGHIDISVNDGNKIENEDYKTDEKIRQEIRDEFLRDVDITIVIVGKDTIHRKHIDWEIRSTIHKFKGNRDGGIIVVNTLINDKTWILNPDLIYNHDGSYPANRSWPANNEMTLNNFEWLPERLRNSLIDNYYYLGAIGGIYKHSVFPIISYLKTKNNHQILKFAIKQALDFKKGNQGKWDTYSKMKRKNNESPDRKQFEQVEWWRI